MSVQLIQQYHNKVERIIRYGGSRNESSLRAPFQDLLEAYARSRSLELIAELEYRTRSGHTIYPDGTLKDALRQDWGYWESKDEKDDLDAEIATKFARGYPQNNILFEDTKTAVLIQSGAEIGRVSLRDAGALDALLTRFVSYESREVREFREAIENFTRDVPALAEELRRLIAEQYDTNPTFQKAAKEFLELCQEAINPNMETADIREMMVQHVLTEEIFVTVFDEPQFHRENIIAHELGGVVGTFYKGNTRRTIDGRIEGYIQVIRARAAQIYNHHEKQKFLKVLYENFYKAYNPKAADRLGIVYTPNEIVRFMIEAADTLCFKHFGKTLGDKGVEILDPATGTGTFPTELIEYLPPHQLEYKYKHELHCNEVAILPYYIANLNIEYTYKQKMGRYEPFENIVFVDTLDNMGFQTQYVRQLGLFGLTDENLERIDRQNKRKISVIIGNPPYNANQKNENENNKNREYEDIDQRIKDTYIKESAAHKTKLYDMFARFYRWASDRLQEAGIIAFVTNRSFIDARTYDGFRKVVGKEFDHIYIVDLGGDVRKNPKLSGTKNNVFGIQTGVAIAFLVKQHEKQELPCQIFYVRRPEMETSTDKLRFLATQRFEEIQFDHIQADKRHSWINLTDNDFDLLFPLATGGGTKLGKSDKKGEKSLFNLFSFGVVTNRDEWVYDLSNESLQKKTGFLINKYNAEQQRLQGKNFADHDLVDEIKWTEDLKKLLRSNLKLEFGQQFVRTSLYRPFFKSYLYLNKHLNWSHYQIPSIFPDQESQNLVICFTSPGSDKPFMCLACDQIPDLHLTGAGAGAQCLPLYRYDSQGHRHDNITDWALSRFQSHYTNEGGVRYPQIPHREHLGMLPSSAEITPETATSSTAHPLTKLSIFHYVYAVLHHPAYRRKYELNLKREFPRIPFYPDFWQWAEWGKELIDLHLNYETVEPYPLLRTEKDETFEVFRNVKSLRQPKARLKANKEAGTIELDTLTTLSGIPPAAWEYKLGNRSALEWVLDRYKETAPKDPTIRDRFHTYRFRDYKEPVIDLLGRVTAVSVQTMSIIAQMPDIE